VAQSGASNRVTVGKLTSVYGIKGWVKVHSYTDPAENIFTLSPWFLEGNPGGNSTKTVVIDDYKVHGKGFIAHIKGVDDRNEAALLCQQMIAADMGELPELPEGEYYWQQLTGLSVRSMYGNCATPILLGRVSSLMETGANDILVVAPCEGSIDRRERLLPYVDACVLEVDLTTSSMLVDWDPEF
jgi:16S rRNA processing protein RimM